MISQASEVASCTSSLIGTEDIPEAYLGSIQLEARNAFPKLRREEKAGDHIPI